MNKTNIDQALAALGDALKSQADNNPLASPLAFVKKLPQRALSGDHINGGKISNFSSVGITDSATSEQLTITDYGLSVKKLSVDTITASIKVNGDITAKTIIADVLEVKEIKADIKVEKDQSIPFGGDIAGKGLLWLGKDYTKQFVYNPNPARFFSSESIDLLKEKTYSIGGTEVLSSTQLGSSITKSNLREVGRLRGLIVDGSMVLNNYVFFNSGLDRLGIGTETPHAAVSIAENGVELIIGSENNRGIIGTFAGNAIDFLTDSTPRLSIDSHGNIALGNKNSPPITVSLNGTLAVNVSTPDSRVKLDIGGAIKFNNAVHLSATEAPKSGTFNQGDIVWNSKPEQRKSIGWVCVKAGSPGIWCAFGEIR